MPSRAQTTFSQSSSRPIISVQTGWIGVDVEAGCRSALEPALDGLADGERAGDRRVDRGVDGDAPAVASSIAASPAIVTGSFTWMFGASRGTAIACSSIASASR